MGKAWSDETKYNMKLSAREIRLLAFCLSFGVNELYDNQRYNWSKVDKDTLQKLWDNFEEYNDRYLCWGFRPDKLGRRGERIYPPIDKP